MHIRNKTTLQEIAEHAHVSTTTVSRVINNAVSVNTETRLRVLNAITRLGYKPALSQSLSQAHLQFDSNAIALIITDILNPFFSEIVSGVEEEAGFSNFAMQLSNTGENPKVERQVLDRLMERRVKGIIACASRLSSSDLISLRDRHDIPMVVINRLIDHPGISCVTINFEEAASQATRHLIDLHHSRIGYLSGRADTESSLARRKGIEKTLASAGLSLPPAWCPTSFPSIEGGFQAMSSLLALPASERPTAVIAYNDLLAIGALRAARAHHLQLPADLSVVGFDGIMMAAHSAPPLTTIEQPKYQMGRLAMRQLHQMMDGLLPSGSYIMVESPLVVRESTAPYKADIHIQ